MGEGVTGLQVGDRVALEPGIPCCSHRRYRWVRNTRPQEPIRTTHSRLWLLTDWAQTLPGHFANGTRDSRNRHAQRKKLRCPALPSRCPACREGRYNLAPIRFFATPPVHGSLAEVRPRGPLREERGLRSPPLPDLLLLPGPPPPCPTPSPHSIHPQSLSHPTLSLWTTQKSGATACPPA